MIRPGLAAVALLAAPGTAGATDALLLQQTAPAGEKATLQLLVDRDRLALAELRQAAKDSYLVELTLAADPNLVLRITCRDLAAGQQVIDALRPRGVPVLDLSGRCRF